jgi:hypothetical protein
MRLFTLLIAAGLLMAGEAWNTKDPAQWSSEEIDRILTNSPWAKSSKVAFDGARSGQTDRGGGSGRTRGGIGLPGGIGFPGGGIGLPGGGSSRRNPYPGGGPSGAPQSSVLVRWESALPVQQALERLGDKTPGAEKSPDKRYVITVFGLPADALRRGGYGQDGDQNDSRDSDRNSTDLRQQLMSATRLVVKGKRSIPPEDVKFNPTGLSREIRFIFPVTETLSTDDKEIGFETRTGQYRIETKFRPKDMSYKGKLEL